MFFDQSKLTQLRQLLTSLFNESELRTLCFDLGVDYENLPDPSKDGKVRELVLHAQRKGWLADLLKLATQSRPQASWPDLPHKPIPDPFPKPTIPHNLPRRSLFVGREAEKVQVHEALLADGYLVSIEGIGGIGKSSLALQVAHECLQAGLDDHESRGIAIFEGLIWLTAKDQELNLDGMLNTVARTLEYVGIAQQPLEEKQVAVQKLLRAKRCLLIMDNSETVTDAGVHQFLRELPEPSKALITTRIQNTPQAYIVSLKGMTQAEALALIRSDGQRLGLPNVAQADDGVLLRLYGATGGAPLALKWALGQIKQKGQSLDIVLTALHEARGAIFEAMFARAWELLSENARRILLIMPLFATSADRGDMEAASAIKGLAMDDALGQLVEMTLVEATSDMEITSRRYSIHPLTRAFAHTHLLDAQSLEEESRMRLANYYMEKGRENGKWGLIVGFPWYEVELPNILTILDWATETKQWAIVTTLFETLVFFLGTRGYWQERVKYGEIALDAVLQNYDEEQIALFRQVIGWVYVQQGHYEKAEVLLKQSIETYAHLEKNRFVVWAMTNLAKVAIIRDDFSTAQRILDEISQIIKDRDDMNTFIAPDVLTIRGRIAFKQGNWVEAQDWFERALIAIEKKLASGDADNSVGSRKIDLGHIALAQGQLSQAGTLFLEALESSQQIQRQDNIAKAQLGLARVHEQRGENAEAFKFARSAKEVFERMLMETELRETEQLLRGFGGVLV